MADAPDPPESEDALADSPDWYDRSEKGVPSIREQLIEDLELGHDLVSAVGRLVLDGEHFQHWEMHDISNKYMGESAARLYVYRELADVPDHLIDSRLDSDWFRRALNLPDDVSERTIANIADEIDERHGTEVRPELQAVAREGNRDRVDELIDPPPVETDGTGPPVLVELTREMRKTGYGAIQLDRDADRSTYEKWELFKPYETAAQTNCHLNDAPDTLRGQDYYYSRTPPTGQTIWNHIRDRSKAEIRAMFLCAYEQYFRRVRKAGFVPRNPDLSLDITDWPWFGQVDDDETPFEERTQPQGTEGTKPGRNYSHSFQMTTVSLANVEIPMTLGVRAISKRKHRHFHLGHLIRYATAVCEPEFVFLDKDFYTVNVKDELKKHDIDFVIGAERGMGKFHDLISGAFLRDVMWNACPWEIGVPEEADDDTKDHYLIVNPSKKRLSRSSTGLNDHSNWEAYYTNVDPEEFPGGGKAIAERYRLRWAVETSYSKLKHEFLSKSASRIQKKREFLVQLGMLYNNMWLAANAVHADRNDQPVKDDQGRYEFTANSFMSSMANDFAPVDIGELTDLSERSDIVEYGMRKEL